MQLPALFLQNIAALLGKEEAARLVRSLEQEASVSIRLNRAKFNPARLNKGIPDSTVPWCPQGRYLERKLTFTFDPLFHAGVYYVQEAASMFLAQVLAHYVSTPVTLLDLCAAPGGKSTLARDFIPEGSVVVANDVVPARARILVENIRKWGHPDVIVTSNLPAELGKLTSAFDVLITDVPCSGEGMFRKDPGAIEEWSLDNVNLCAKRQRDILQAIWPALKPGGLLIYSTCTFNLAENEANVAWIAQELGADILPVPTEEGWNISENRSTETFPVYRFLPHRTRGEGLFVAVLKKGNNPSNSPADFLSPEKRGRKTKKEKRGGVPYSTASHPDLYKWFSHGEKGLEKDWELSSSDLYSAFRSIHRPILRRLKENGLNILAYGIPLATQKGKDFVPHPGLAWSQALHPNAFPQIALSYEQAIAFLRKEGISLPTGSPRGYVLVTFASFPLGFIKNIGTRNNNLYPLESRIRSAYNPEEIRILE